MYIPVVGAPGSHFEAELASLEAREPAKAQVIAQYRAVAGKFVELWAEIDKRTENSEWRTDGIGSCHVSPNLFETYVGGPAGYELEELWEAREEDKSDFTFHACRFHKEGQGCMLGDLKSPRCISYVGWDHHAEIKSRLGVELPDFVTPLIQIQGGGLGEDDCLLHPEVNDEVVDRTVAETEVFINHVKTFPVLHPAPGV